MVGWDSCDAWMPVRWEPEACLLQTAQIWFGDVAASILFESVKRLVKA